MKEFISTAEAAKYLKMSQAAIYKLTSRKEIPFYKPGKRILFEVSELDAWLLGSKSVSKSSSNLFNNPKIKN